MRFQLASNNTFKKLNHEKLSCSPSSFVFTMEAMEAEAIKACCLNTPYKITSLIYSSIALIVITMDTFTFLLHIFFLLVKTLNLCYTVVQSPTVRLYIWYGTLVTANVALSKDYGRATEVCWAHICLSPLPQTVFHFEMCSLQQQPMISDITWGNSSEFMELTGVTNGFMQPVYKQQTICTAGLF